VSPVDRFSVLTQVSEDSSSTTVPSVAPVNESGPANESAEPELRPSDLPDTTSLKAVDGCDAISPDKSPSTPVEGEALVSPQCLGKQITTFFAWVSHRVVGSVHAWGFQIEEIYEFVEN